MSNGSKMLISKKLGVLLSDYLTPRFKRVHRSYVINENHIKEYHRELGGYYLSTSGFEVPVSKNYLNLL